MSNGQILEPGTERALRSSTRNPRRRPRNDVDSVKTAPRRKRSKISEDTFVPPRHDEDEESMNGTIEVAPMNGSANPPSPAPGRGRPKKESAPLPEMEVTLRGKRNSVKRPTRGDGATILTQNARYSVRLLPSTPKELRSEGLEYRGSLGGTHSALAVTRERAFIWDYTSHTPVSSPRIFDIPFTVKPTDPLPFGALVSTGTSTDPGLLLISATTGKVVFYESIERAASLGLFRERSVGVEGSLGSLFSGETTSDLIFADHAGFVVTLSSGRIAQLTLRDAQGKANVSTQFLRATEQSSGSFFSSIKGFLGPGAWKRDVSAIHTRPLGSKGQMQVISLTEKAELQTWDIDWTGQYTFNGTVALRDALVQELKRLDSPELQGKSENVTALDFAIVDKSFNSQALATVVTERPIDLVLLIRVGTLDNCEYVLADVSNEGENLTVTQIIPLRTCQARSGYGPKSRPRLLLPTPRHTALIAFDDAFTLTARDTADANSPEAQLHASYVQPALFEDTVHLRQAKGISILAACEENHHGKQASGIVFVQGAGLVRVSVTNPNPIDFTERVPIKTRIEEAVFYGALQDGNILDFSHVGETTYTPNEVEVAALTISDEILKSTSPFISTSPTSMEAHLAHKSQALRALATHVRQSYPTISKDAMWQLLWDAEKVAAAQQIWKTFQEHKAACSQEKRKATLLDEVCALAIMREEKLSEDIASNEDVVYSFFVHHLAILDTLLLLAYDVLKSEKDATDKSPATKIRLVNEADDLWIGALGTSFAFRADNAATYGILPAFIEDGVLTDVTEYAGLPEFWTSTERMLKTVVHMTDISRKYPKEAYEQVADDPEATAALNPMLIHVNEENAHLVQLLCSIYQERINWLSSRPDMKLRQHAETLRAHYINQRHEECRELADVAQAEAGMRLAEKYKDMHTLTEMVIAETQFTLEELSATPDKDQKPIQNRLDQLTARVDKYFEKFGDDWSNAYFDVGFSSESGAGIMLQDAQEKWPEALRTYLHADASRAKISWINDITSDADFGRACESLTLAAKEQETQLWPKKIELSMSKLALLAVQEGLQAEAAAMTEQELQKNLPQGELGLVDIQRRIYLHLLPEIQHCVDGLAELTESIKKVGLRNQDLTHLHALFTSSLERLLSHSVLSADEIIDLLTLMDSGFHTEGYDHSLQGAEFFLALRVLNITARDIPQSSFETLLRIIWKRCYVYDDWVEINTTQKKSDEENIQALRDTAPWRTLYYAFDQAFFDAPDCHVRYLPPSECLGAGCSRDDLSYRWSDEQLLDPILGDNKIHDEQLQAFIEDRRLDHWIEDCVQDVKNAVELQAEQKALKLQRERDFEASFSRAETNGYHANGVNGIKTEQIDDEDASFADVDGDGDVDMA